MSSISALLNDDAAAASRREQHARSDQSSSSTTTAVVAATTTYEAADALTALATLGGGHQYSRELPSPTAFHAPRRASSYGSSQVAPVEPSPPIDQPQPHSPSLEQYHHGSRSPEETKRRQSFVARAEDAPVLAPIQNLSSALHERVHDENQPPSSATAYGEDISQNVPPPSRSADDSEDTARDDTQNREPAFVRTEPTTSQIREPDSVGSTPHPVATSLPLGTPADARLPSPQPFIKHEPTGTPRDTTPSSTAAPTAPADRRNSASTDNMDADTLKAIEIAKQTDLGLRVKRNTSVADSVTSPTEPKPVPAPSKKRPAPSSAPTIKKKGMATAKKPAPKKRKIDTDPESAPRSSTPTSRSKPAPGKGGKKGSQAGTPVAESSPAPDNSSQVGHSDEDPADTSDDNAIYCICRKPDNHRWMIGCDGGCDDWFHGDCVKMNQADEALVDKFICPLCEKAGRGHTTYKPMCRRPGCRKPARVVKGNMSKYCSDECGVHFMTEQLQRTAGGKNSNSRKKPKKKTGKPHDDADHLSDEDDEPTPLGGVLRAKDLKALVEASPNIETFKGLGSGVLSPPHTASPTKASFEGPVANGTAAYNPADDLSLTPSEREHLGALHKEKSDLKERLELLKDREKFVSMIKEQATRVAEREKIKVKDFCGYDSRLSWSDAEFLAWRKSEHGRAAFKFSTASPSAEEVASIATANGEDFAMVNGDDAEKESVCLKKRCSKHPQWQKLNLQDARFEELEVVEAIKECEKEERSVRERARRRSAKDAMEKELTGGESDKAERNREGWVEVVQS
ncbi:hypothetical protein BS50DRAFT_357037 [Corynespora cassiicola Philippines]|uniref:PHD-type domain-containing protein n=1 Tax=Corynespora cassiicola Philippines TaxID=1448308 RepID=A0A2T2NRP0_CORCC|nr:hypothetical protein BS50DRAFT_357037 [Corynespora cassiicola Philippines]